jgi:hypothetical protein
MSISLAQALPDQTLATHPEGIIDPGAVMNAQADVYIFDIPAQAGAPRSFARRLVDAIMESRRRAAEISDGI